MGIAPADKRFQSKIQIPREGRNEECPGQGKNDGPKFTHGSKVMRLERPHRKIHKVKKICQTPRACLVSSLLLDVSLDDEYAPEKHAHKHDDSNDAGEFFV